MLHSYTTSKRHRHNTSCSQTVASTCYAHAIISCKNPYTQIKVQRNVNIFKTAFKFLFSIFKIILIKSEFCLGVLSLKFVCVLIIDIKFIIIFNVSLKFVIYQPFLSIFFSFHSSSSSSSSLSSHNLIFIPFKAASFPFLSSFLMTFLRTINLCFIFFFLSSKILLSFPLLFQWKRKF